MSLETATYIDTLVPTNPLSSDPRSEGDDHIRLLKATLQATFPNITGAVTPTQTELNHVAGVTSSIQAQIDTKPPLEIGTVCLFYQAAAPTGWTKIITQDNKALRITNSTGGSAGGSQPFTTAFASRAVVGTVGFHALTIAEMPAHTHTFRIGTSDATGSVWPADGDGPLNPNSATTESTGSGNGHTHTFTGTAIDLAVQYLNVIMASRTT